MRRIAVASAVVLVLSVFSAQSHADLFTLYDPSAGTLPGNQGWLPFVITPSTQTNNGTTLNLNTTANRGSQSGYFSESPTDGSLQHPLMPVLDRSTGYIVKWQLQVLSEGHNTRDDNGDGLDDRAGFSVIAISEDLRGLEIGFFENRIWAYAGAGEGTNSRFTQAEGVDFDTTNSLTNYELSVNNNSYELFANGSSILSGNLRNYNPSGVNATLDPYDNPSFLFFGDDTGSADSNVLIGTIAVQTVPEPSTLLFLGVGSLGFAAWRLRKRVRSAQAS